MKTDKNSYIQILKATSLFGGVKFFNILISIIKSKIIAILLGPTGIGVMTLFNSTLAVISNATGFGLETSGIKNISEAYGSKSNEKLNKQIQIFKYLIFITSILGALITCVFSSFLSQLVFNNKDFTIAFIWLAFAILFRQLFSGCLTVLQSLRKLQQFAKANLMGNSVALLIAIPLYYYWKINAIAPVIAISSFISFLFAYFYSKNFFRIGEKISLRKNLKTSKQMLVLGFALSISELIRSLSEYLVQFGINFYGGVNEVGYYGAGLVILNSYVGIIFAVMSKNYYPRLSEICNQNVEIKKLAFHQSFISILLITIIIIVFIIFNPLIIRTLFSVKFDSVTNMVSWGILGMLFKAISWTLGYIIIAKGDSKIFIKTSLVFSVLYIILLLLGYYKGGLLGLGISFFVYYVIHFCGIIYIVSKYYHISLDREIYSIFTRCCFLCMIVFLLSFLPWVFYKYLFMGLAGILSCVYILILFNKKIPIRELFVLLFKKDKDV